MKEKLLEYLKVQLPPVFGRTAIEKLMPGLINARTLANDDYKGQGPISYKLGSKRMYKRDDFIEWLSSRITSIESV